MSRKLLIAVLFLSGCASSIAVKAPPVQTATCPPVAPTLPCDAERAAPGTLSELQRAWLEAQANAEDCKALADTWMEWWKGCQ